MRCHQTHCRVATFLDKKINVDKVTKYRTDNREVTLGMLTVKSLNVGCRK